MSVTYSAATKTARMTAVRDKIDAGAGPGILELCSASYAAVLATLTLADPCGVVSGDTLTFDFPVTDPSADNTGTAAVARIKDSDGNVVISGLTVGTTGTDIVLSSTAITAGQPVSLTSGVIHHAA